jgi:D-alanyl-D-alanine carboxypeptidase
MISAYRGENAYVLCLSDDTALYEKDADAQVAPASTTKMLTAITALDFCGPYDAVTVGEEIERMASDASRAYLNQGDRLYVRQLLVAMLLPSGNDAAYSLAVFTGRKIAGDQSLSIDDALSLFYDAMNAKAEAVGAAHSHFLSPDGYDADGQYTTAYDLAASRGSL